jgi:hypothetical protein
VFSGLSSINPAPAFLLPARFHQRHRADALVLARLFSGPPFLPIDTAAIRPIRISHPGARMLE